MIGSKSSNTSRRSASMRARTGVLASAGAILLLTLAPLCEAQPARRGGRFDGGHRGPAPRVNDAYAYPVGYPSNRYGDWGCASDDLYSPGYTRVYGAPLIYNSWGGGYGYGWGWGYGAYRRYGGYYSYYDGYYDSPSPYFTLVEIDATRAATRRRAGSANLGAGSDFHSFQIALRDAAATNAPRIAPAAPATASAPPAPRTLIKGESEQPDASASAGAAERPAPNLSEQTKGAWAALEGGRLEEAQRRFSLGADAPIRPGEEALRAGCSLGFALAALMLDREESAAWAMRRAGDLKPDLAALVPWSDTLRTRLAEAAGAADMRYRNQPTPDRAVIVGTLDRLLR